MTNCNHPVQETDRLSVAEPFSRGPRMQTRLREGLVTMQIISMMSLFQLVLQLPVGADCTDGGEVGYVE